jgi:16S rRNA (cytidine1402-2'-O)-methyltransferase
VEVGLTFVPTPLGNLRDVTLRALDVLRGCDLVVAEDTRVARRLLTAFEITGKRIVSYREQNALTATDAILRDALTQDVAVVTDAGTPGISDPGRGLLRAARARGIAVEVLPGPVAFVVAAVLSGFDLTDLTFAGFVPRALGARRSALEEALARSGPTAWYETPQRIVATLETLQQIAPGSDVFIGRELTKRFEQQILATPAGALGALERPVRGEIVLVVAPLAPAPPGADAQGVSPEIDRAIDALLDLQMPVAEIAKIVAGCAAGDRSTYYARTVERKRARGDGTT